MASQANRGLSSRAVLLTLAIAVIAGVAVLLRVASSGPPAAPSPTTASAPSTTAQPSGSLEGTSEHGSARAGAPEPKIESSTSKPVAGSLVVSGTVKDARTSAAIAGARLEGIVQPSAGEQRASGSAVTDSEGRYSVEIAWSGPPRTVELRVRGERIKHEEALIDPGRFQPLPGSEGKLVASVDFETVGVLAVRGRLVNEADGRPIQGTGWTSAILVRVAKAPALPEQIPECGSEWGESPGEFVIQVEAMVPGELAILGAASGHLARMKPAALDPTRTVDIGDIALPEGVCIEGVVSTADGSRPFATHVFAKLLSPAGVWMHLEDGSWTARGDALVPWRTEATIGADGSFQLCGLVSEEYVVQVDYAGCRTPSRLDSVQVQAPASGVRLPISTAVYRLTARDARSGEKIERARFHFDELADFDCPIEDDGVIATDPAVESPGRIVAEGYVALKCSLPALAACEVRDLEFRLEPLAQRIAATIVVASPAGDPVQDVEVEIRADAGSVDGQGPIPRLSHTAPDGRHELPLLAPGTYHLLVEPWRDGDPSVETWLGAEIELHVREGMEPIEVRLEEGGLVRATLTRSDATPVEARTSILPRSGGEPAPIDWRNDAGTFAGWIPGQTPVRLARPLPAGSWTLRFDADGCEPQDVVVNVLAGETTAIEVALVPKPPR